MLINGGEMDNSTNCCRVDVDESLLQNAKLTLSQEQKSIAHKAKIFALLGNEVRLKIMYLFLEYERMCVCDLGDVLEMKQSPISQHLRKLKDASLLENKREGMTIFYFIPTALKAEIQKLIKGE